MPYDIGNNNIALPPVENYRPNSAAISLGQVLGNLVRAPDPEREKAAQEILALKRKERGISNLMTQYAANPDIANSYEAGFLPGQVADAHRLDASLNGTDSELARAFVGAGGSLGENQGVSLNDRERVAGRNAGNSLSQALTVQAAKPQSESEWKAQQLNKDYNNLDSLNSYQRQAIGINPMSRADVEGKYLDENFATATPEEKSRVLYGNPPSSGESIITNPDGTMTFTRGAQALKQQQAGVAKEDIDYIMESNRKSLDNLVKLGGMSTSDSQIEQRAINQAQAVNIPGNAMLQRVISPEQAIERDAIKAQRALLINLYRTAANIPASASNSNLEQTTLKDALPDDTLSREANELRRANFMAIYGAAKSRAQPTIGQALTPQGGGEQATVTVTNGTETLSIPASDLPQAAADGFRRVQ